MNKMFRNILLLASGTAAGQLILFAVAPILTRLYQPEDFGTLAIFTSLLSIFITVAAFRYDFAMLVSKNHKELMNLLVLSFLVLSSITLIISITLYFTKDYVIEVFSMNIKSAFLYLLPLSLFGLAGYGILNKLAIKKQNYKVIAKTKFTQSLAVGIAQTLLGAFFIKPGLIIGDVIGRFSGMLKISSIITIDDKKEMKKVSWKSLKEVMIRYKSYPLYSTTSNLLNNVTLQMPPLILALFFGDLIVGFYALLSRVVGIPMRFIGASVSEVYLGEITKRSKRETGSIKEIFHKLILRLFLLAIVPFIIVVLFAPQIFSIIFGSQWVEAGEYLRILSVLYLVQFVMFPLSQTLEALEKQKIQLFWQVTRFILVFISLILPPIFNLSIELTLVCYSTAVVISYIIIYVLMLNQIGKEV